jgi:protein O-GlcNAc transferase
VSVQASFEQLFQTALDALSAGHSQLALTGFKACTALQPEHAHVWFLLGASHDQSGQIMQAEQAFANCLRLDSAHPQAANARAAMLIKMGRTQDAIAAFETALALNPGDPRTQTNLGIAHEQLAHNDEALACYSEALRISPAYPGALNSRGILLLRLKRLQEALLDHLLFVRHAPAHVLGHYYCAATYSALHRDEEALAACDAALRIAPQHTKSYFLRGVVLSSLARMDEASTAFELGMQNDAKQFEEMLSETGMDTTIARNGIPDPVNIHCLRNMDRLRQCNWQRYEQFVAYLKQQINCWSAFPAQGRPDRAIAHTVLALPLSEQAHYELARSVAAGIAHSSKNIICIERPAGTAGHQPNPHKIRIAYVSPDFREHATAHLTRSMYARHDREQFTIYAYALNADDGSVLRRQIAQGCDAFHDVSAYSTAAIAALIQEHQIDILVDLAGYTAGARPELFMMRPAPVNLAYLGYAGSTGSDSIDYFLTNPFSSSPEQAAFYSEKMVFLPATCFPYDEQQKISTPETRADYGLPEHAFVFCCFNNSWKIEPTIFAVWMRLLHRLPNSVLWLYAPDPHVQKNLQHEAGKRGIAPSRLVFAAHLPVELHLARYRVADLFLDTFFYGAHTTAMDALWAGLPMISRRETLMPHVSVAAILLHWICRS